MQETKVEGEKLEGENRGMTCFHNNNNNNNNNNNHNNNIINNNNNKEEEEEEEEEGVCEGHLLAFARDPAGPTRSTPHPLAPPRNLIIRINSR